MTDLEVIMLKKFLF